MDCEFKSIFAINMSNLSELTENKKQTNRELKKNPKPRENSILAIQFSEICVGLL